MEQIYQKALSEYRHALTQQVPNNDKEDPPPIPPKPPFPLARIIKEGGMVHQTINCSCGRYVGAGRTQSDVDKRCLTCRDRHKLKLYFANNYPAKKKASVAETDWKCPCGCRECSGDHFPAKEPSARERALEDLLEAARLIKTDPSQAEMEIIKRVEEIDHLPVSQIRTNKPLSMQECIDSGRGILGWLLQPFFRFFFQKRIDYEQPDTYQYTQGRDQNH